MLCIFLFAAAKTLLRLFQIFTLFGDISSSTSEELLEHDRAII